jgi:hypothetical protein
MNQTPNPTNHKPLLMIDKAAPSAAVSHPAITLPAEADYGRYGLSARIILSALSRMALGRLRFQMPDGKEWIFGGAQPEFPPSSRSSTSISSRKSST